MRTSHSRHPPNFAKRSELSLLAWDCERKRPKLDGPFLLSGVPKEVLPALHWRIQGIVVPYCAPMAWVFLMFCPLNLGNRPLTETQTVVYLDAANADKRSHLLRSDMAVGIPIICVIFLFTAFMGRSPCSWENNRPE